ncbi:MAG TPA: hypothetical protein DDW30_02445 [Clostridiales bacterium]|nr:hypothetical protein [Clostridiales bacterium]
MHQFDKGVCTVCGHVGCDHKTLHTKTLDLHELGLCASVFTYRICDCGTVVETDDDFLDNLNCSIDNEAWNAAFPESEAEKGEVHGTVTCEKCGLNVEITMQFTEDGCLFRSRYVITLKKDDKVLLDHAVSIYENHDHFEVRAEIPLPSADGFCGGTLAVLKCKYCGEITKKLALKPTCKFDFVHGLTNTEETDANGVKHTIARGVCPDCGLTKEFDAWVEKDGCDEVSFTAERIYRGDKMLLSMIDEDLQKSHNFVPTYEALGEGSCYEDGMKTTYRCTTCNLSVYSYEYQHASVTEVIKIKELGGCDTQISVWHCMACGEVISFSPEWDVRQNNCQMEETSQTYTKDGVEHTVTTNTCSECGLQIIVDAWEILHGKNGGCGYTDYESYRVIYGEQTLISYQGTVDDGIRHDWDEENAIYECDPDMACEDGYYNVVLTCKRCGEKQTMMLYGHDKDDFGIELDDYGCGGYVGGWLCRRCGDLYSDIWNFDCEKNGTLVWSETPVETTDKNGLVHKTWTGTCSACGLQFIREEWAEKEDAFGCRTKYYVAYQILKDDEVILKFHSDEVVDKHNDDEHMKTVYDREGACEDGYYKTSYCPTCGLASADHMEGHKEAYRSIDAKELGFCHGSFNERYCVVCGEIQYQQDQLECDFVEDEGSDGKSKTCSVCGAKVLYVDKDEEIDPCHLIVISEDHYINKNGEDVYVIEYQSRFTTHKEEYDFEFYGTSCSEGYRVRKVCSVCGETTKDWVEKPDHRLFDHEAYEDLFVWDNVEGVCESHVGAVKIKGCACGFLFYFEQGDLVYDQATKTYGCSECALKLVQTVTEDTDGCKKTTTKRIVITFGDKVLFSGEETAVTPQHSFGSFELIEAENGLTLRTTCEHCRTNADTEIVRATHPEGRTDWSFEFTPAVNGIYTFQLLVGKTLKISEKDGDHFVQKDYDPNGRIRWFMKAGQTYKLSWAESETTEKWEAYIAILPSHANCGGYINNNGYGVLLPGSETCEDGMLRWSYCSSCGAIGDNDSLKLYYEHKTRHWYLPGHEIGICDGGQFILDECPCGGAYDIGRGAFCKGVDEVTVDSEFYGGCKLETYTCTKCGLYYEVYYKETTDEETGAVTVDYLYVVITVHDEVVYSWGTPPTAA